MLGRLIPSLSFNTIQDLSKKMFNFDHKVSNKFKEFNCSESNEMNLLDFDFVSVDDWDFNVEEIEPLMSLTQSQKLVQKKNDCTSLIKSSGSHLDPMWDYSHQQSQLPSSFKILKDYDTTRFIKRSKTEQNIIISNECIKENNGSMLSTDEILRLGAEKFIQSFTIRGDQEPYMFSHPFASSFLGLPEEDTRNVALVENLLASAEKVGQKQFDRATRILNECDKLCSNTGNAIQRLVYYFSQALHERIDRETGRDSSKGIEMKRLVQHIEHSLMNLNLTMIAAHQNIPLSQVTQFTAVQAIIDHVGESKKVHIIDLKIGSGMQWTILMQALVTHQFESESSSIKHLKITALCTKLRHKIEETRERLMDFAKSLNLLFSFNIVMVKDMTELKQEDFEIDHEESIAIFAQYILMWMLARPDKLDSLMRVIKGINPRAMIVIEVEANHNSPVFVDRFVEALFFYGAFFDSLEDCMKNDERNRTATELEHLSQGIRSIVATEGEERTIRHVKVDVWRAFFARYGMEEMELSMSSLYQANLVLKNFACGSCCTLEMNNNCLLIGWKGTPLNSLSAWKFF